MSSRVLVRGADFSNANGSFQLKCLFSAVSRTEINMSASLRFATMVG